MRWRWQGVWVVKAMTRVRRRRIPVDTMIPQRSPAPDSKKARLPGPFMLFKSKEDLERVKRFERSTPTLARLALAFPGVSWNFRESLKTLRFLAFSLTTFQQIPQRPDYQLAENEILHRKRV
ncbi:hypothetical protein MES4922_60126 [Mesorhizobium ventifaucium]|uniref:Uncharacterized protein n=1 Tax=Mesorhizobium ventifaucium TaxID=666020 RepID=A0ABN8KA95_9HYPH|nr:hypothetical protein MES4922_60126 [Mesorhizobium ventifaucium]